MAQKVYGFLRGNFLTNEDAFKNWRFIAFVTFLAMIMIYTGHSLEKKVHYMAQLNDLSNELRSEYMDGQKQLMFMQWESEVEKNLAGTGIAPASNPPRRILVSTSAKQDK
ncbi:MAG: FtsL-like putative cell division protein [Nonlabens sp.]